MNDETNRDSAAATISNEVEDALTRHNRNWMADGIVEIVLGSLWFVWGLIVVLPMIFPGRVLIELRLVLLMGSMGAMPVLLKRAIRGWKERVSFPRTGYVELQRPRSRWKITLIVFGSAFVGLIISRGSRPVEQWLALGLGAVMFLAMILTAWKMRAARLMALSPLVLATAMTSFLLGLRFSTCSGVLLLAYAFVNLLDGLLRLRSYLKAHPEPAGATL